MINIVTPLSFAKERAYIIETLFHEFLGLEINILIEKTEQYKIILPNKTELILNDSFFSNFTEDKDYLAQDNIPPKVIFTRNDYLVEADIPIIYGDETIEITEQSIHCGIDIFASCFFMLTRWEEYVIKEKDKHGRFSDFESLAYKSNFHKRPIVNEYTELLWRMMYSLDNSLIRKERKYSVTITHDVDNIRRYDTIFKYIKALGGDLLLRKNPLLWFSTTKDFIKCQLNLMKDPHDTFDLLMDISEKYNLKSHFFFMPNHLDETDARYDVRSSVVKESILNINKRGHLVGIHSGYDSFNNKDIFLAELQRLNSIDHKINEGRQHYLKFENPTTWQLWEDNELKIDSTIGYSHFAGFRAGTCYEYPVFNILSRRKLNLIEKPLIAMEGAVKEEHDKVGDFVNEIVKLSKLTKRYNGDFVFLWHNNNINVLEWKNYFSKYEQIIDSIK